MDTLQKRTLLLFGILVIIAVIATFTAVRYQSIHAASDFAAPP